MLEVEREDMGKRVRRLLERMSSEMEPGDTREARDYGVLRVQMERWEGGGRVVAQQGSREWVLGVQVHDSITVDIASLPSPLVGLVGGLVGKALFALGVRTPQSGRRDPGTK